MKRLFLLFTLLLLVAVAGATIRYVPGQYPTIQAGIDAANSGDTVLVAPGVYVENVQMRNGVNLFGSGMDKTIVDGGGLDNVISAWYGVLNYIISDLSVRNSEQSGSAPGCVGIHLNPNSSSGTKTVRRCHIYNCGHGLQIWNDFGGVAYIEDNVINNNLYDGISPYLGTTYFRNNTIINNGRDGYHDWSGGGTVNLQNNIIANNTRYGIFRHQTTPVFISYNDLWNNTGGNYMQGSPAQPFTPSPGTGEISASPLFLGPPYPLAEQFYITWTSFPNDSTKSPCIDAGNPDPQFNDPDGTRGDMGALIFDQRVYNAHVNIAPVGVWVVQPGGGNLMYSIQLVNNESFSVTLTGWNMVTLPNGSLYGPVFGPLTLTIPAGIMVSRIRSLYVPASAPPGQYYFHSYAGHYPNHPWDHTFYPFTKLAGSGNGGSMALEEWVNTEIEGELAGEPAAQIHQPSSMILHTCAPNPFNPTTTISYELRAASFVSLEVYDVAGRWVTTLVNGWRDTGRHEVTFDGSGLAAGVYLCRLEAEGQSATTKMVLTK